jgi:GMC oxidoreductase
MDSTSNRRTFLKKASLATTALLGLEAPLIARQLTQVPTDDQSVIVRFRTNRYAPPSVLELRIKDASGGDDQAFQGEYAEGAWTFKIPIPEKKRNLLCRFALDGQEYGEKSTVTLEAKAGNVYEYDTYDISLTVFDELAQSRSPLMERMFWKEPETKTFDVIVIGSGMGGGVLADQLSDLGLNVAVLEAGSLLFSTHIGNLPRPTKVGRFTKHIWELWYRYGIKDYTQGLDSVYEGAQGYNVGGRSVFWGGLIPRMSEWELSGWPQEIRSYLLTKGYEDAERLVKKSDYKGWKYQESAKEFLSKSFSSFHVKDAPLGIDYPKTVSRPLLPAGVFSTVDLLMESILTGPESSRNYPKVLQRHPAVRINHEGGKVSGVTVLDLDRDQFVEFKASAYVLAAGSLESSKLALSSNLEPRSAVGKGFTDHPVFYTHFGIPRSSALYRENDAAKILMQNKSSSQTKDPFNIVIELGADLNHGRFVDPSLLEAHRKAKSSMLCEIVFLAGIPLNEKNSIAMKSDRFYSKPLVEMHGVPDIDKIREQILPLHKEILAKLGAVSLQDETLELKLAPAGGVAHEAGSLRMSASPETGVVDKDLRFHCYENLWACDLSVLPSSPAANPSLTLIALALRLADHLKANIG